LINGLQSSFENIFSGKAELTEILDSELKKALKEKINWQINNKLTSKNRR
jgi:hypothetical protein